MRSGRSNLRFLEDLAKVATGAVGSLSELRGQVKHMVKERVDHLMDDMDFVSREEFERVESIAKKARIRQEELEKRLSILEKKLATKPQKKKTKK